MPLAPHHAASVLGWSGVVIDNVGILGHRVSAVVRVRADVDGWRRTHGWPPHGDPSWFRTWFDAAKVDSTPLPAVELVGVLVTESDAERALAACGTLVSLAPCAAVLPGGAGGESLSLTELDYYGVGVVAGDSQADARLIIRPEDRSVEFGPSLYGRWLLEVLYDRIIQERNGLGMPSRDSCHDQA